MKTMYKTIISFLSLCLIFSGIQAQSLERDVFSSAGTIQSASGVELSSSMGEAVTSTFTSGTVILNQGFQQSGLISTKLPEKESVSVDYSLYPNPTSDQLNLKLDASKNAKATLRILSVNGRQLRSDRIRLTASQPYQKVFDLSNLPAGNYVISIQGSDGKSYMVEQIQKIK